MAVTNSRCGDCLNELVRRARLRTGGLCMHASCGEPYTVFSCAKPQRRNGQLALGLSQNTAFYPPTRKGGKPAPVLCSPADHEDGRVSATECLGMPTHKRRSGRRVYTSSSRATSKIDLGPQRKTSESSPRNPRNGGNRHPTLSCRS